MEEQSRRLLRPGEYTSHAAAVKSIEDGVRTAGISTTSNYVRGRQPDPFEVEFEKISNILLPTIRKLANNELSKEELTQEFGKAQEKQKRELEALLITGKSEYVKDPIKKAIKAQYDQIHKDHQEWSNSGWQYQNRPNPGMLSMPHDVAEWSEEQKAELYRLYPIFQFINDPEDYEQIDGYLGDRCEDYRNGKDSDPTSDCPCILSGKFGGNDRYLEKTLITVAVGSNYWQLLEYLADVARENAHMRFLLFRWMHRYEPSDKTFRVQGSTRHGNIFFELNMEYVPKNDDDDPTKPWEILTTVQPYCKYMTPKSFEKFPWIQTNDNLSGSYWQWPLSFMIAAGRHELFLEQIRAQPDMLNEWNLPQILVEIANSGSVDLLEKTGEILMEYFAVRPKYHKMLARKFLFPQMERPRLTNTFLHAAIERRDIEYFGKAVTFLFDFYNKREETKIRNREYYQQLEESEGGLSDKNLKMYETYWKDSEDLVEDLENRVNTDCLNVLEYAIVYQEEEMETILLALGMPNREKYEYLRKYVGFLHGNPKEFLLDILDNMKEIYPSISLASLLPYMPIGGVQKILEVYAKYPNIYGARQKEDMTAALASLLYPRAGFQVEEKLRDQDQIDKVKKIMAALLMAGGEIQLKNSNIGEIPNTLPSEISEVLDYVAEARSKYSYPLNPHPAVETADLQVFEFFRH